MFRKPHLVPHLWIPRGVREGVGLETDDGSIWYYRPDLDGGAIGEYEFLSKFSGMAVCLHRAPKDATEIGEMHAKENMTPKDNTRNRCAEEKYILQHVFFKA